MKISRNWLEDWVAVTLETEALAERLTLAGHEVDGIETLDLEGFQIAHIKTVEPHPNADKLKVCQVSIASSEPLQIVCGAPNARAGLRVVLAPVGVRMPDGQKIRRSKLRGVESQGMLCSVSELGLGDEHDGIMELPDDAPVGTALAEYLGLPDAVIEVDLTPNRGDCFSVLGIAREVAAFTGVALKDVPQTSPEAEVSDVWPVTVEATDACPRFVSRVVRGIDPSASSPVWMTERLRRAGLRAIHPVVDVTNYVMLELGQPLHGYDLDKLSGPIVVRAAKQSESCTLLDSKAVELAGDVTVISDDTGAIGMAGIMGGLSTSVSDATCNVLLEGAFWSPSAIAGRARRYGMHTDASLRFERGVDPALQARAVDRATELLLQIAGGQAGPVSEVSVPDRLQPKSDIELAWEKLNRVLGLEISSDKVGAILRSLGMNVSETDTGVRVRPPSYRFDMHIGEDLIEEIARVYGYDELPETTAIYQTELRAETELRESPDTLRHVLQARGYSEIISYSFVDPAMQTLLGGEAEELALSNPISSELSVMRRSLLPGLVSALKFNRARQRVRIRLYETGNCFQASASATLPVETPRIGGIALGSVQPEQWGEPARALDFFDIKSDIEALFAGRASELVWQAFSHPALHPGQSAEILLGGKSIGWAGALHPGVQKQLDLDDRVLCFEIDVNALLAAQLPKAAALSRFPVVRRDLSVLIDADIPAAELIETVRGAIPNMLREVRLFDVYDGKGIEPGRKSVALGLILQETSRTLTDEETDRAVHSATSALEQKLGAKLRDR